MAAIDPVSPDIKEPVRREPDCFDHEQNQRKGYEAVLIEDPQSGVPNR